MKKIILSLIFILTLTTSFSQIFYSSTTNNLRYMGEMTDKVISFLDSSEIQMYYDCLDMVKLKKDSVIWLKGDYYNQVFHKQGEYTVEFAVREVKNNRYRTSTLKGDREKELPQPMCLIFISRQDGNFRISIQKYF